MNPDDLTYTDKLTQATNDELKVRDSDGYIYWVDSWDDDGVHYHADDGDTYRMTHDQFKQAFTFIPTDPQ